MIISKNHIFPKDKRGNYISKSITKSTPRRWTKEEESWLLMLKDKGCVIHTSNLCGFFGRGFYSLSPALFRDFYKVNNFDIKFSATKKRGEGWIGFDPNNTYLKNANLSFQEDAGIFINSIPNDSLICCFAKRDKAATFTKPVPEHFIKTNGK